MNLDTVTRHMDRAEKAAAKRGFADCSNKGAAAVNPFAKLAEGKKWSAWQAGCELAARGIR